MKIFNWLHRRKNKCPNCGFDLNRVSVISSDVYKVKLCPICRTDISGSMNIVDLRPESEKQIELRTQYDLGGEDEQFARRLVELQRGQKSTAAKVEIRKIGEKLGANGGNDRMVRIAYRVEHLGGSSRQLEWDWAGICGWQP